MPVLNIFFQAVAEQKLIYSGQLLTDDIVLKDVLRKYEGQNTHSMHLVCAPPRGTPDSWKRSVTNVSQTPQQSQSVPSAVTSSQVSETHYSGFYQSCC
jgi:hypothetical protein